MRDIEDPVQRNQVALDLFKTKAEDLGDALFALDLSNAVEQLGQVDGAARKMFDTLADNDATKIEQAQRNVEVAMQGIQGALAAGFSEPFAQAAEFVSQNRGPVMQFFLDLTNGALDFGATMVNSAADGAIAFSEFIAGPGADMIDMLIGIQKSINPFSDTSELEGLRDGMREADDATRATADTMRNELLGGIEQARAKVDEFGGKAVAMGYLNDASLRLAGSIADIGVQADGSKLSLDGVDAANLRASESGRTLDAQLRSAVDAMREELNTAAAAGEGQDELAARYDTTRQALYDSLVQMGLTKDQADLLIQTYGAVPSLVPTAIQTNAPEVRAEVERLKYALDNVAGTRDIIINKIVRETGADRGQVAAAYNAPGAVLLPRAKGAIDGLGLTAMRPLAQMVPPDTYRVVGDRSDVAELFAPLDGSPRSWSLLMEGFRRMPGAMPMAEGGILGEAAVSAPAVNVGPIDARVDLSPREAEIRRIVVDAIRDYNREQYGRGGV